MYSLCTTPKMGKVAHYTLFCVLLSSLYILEIFSQQYVASSVLNTFYWAQYSIV